MSTRRAAQPAWAEPGHGHRVSTNEIGRLAADCLRLEIRTYPKPGLVSHIDQGAHPDMDCALLEASAETLRPYFQQLADAGRVNADMNALRRIGIAAEARMLRCTEGVNTHRGAIFGLGLLCAAAGLREASGLKTALGQIVAERWGADISAGPRVQASHGAIMQQRYGAGGARAEAASGFHTLYAVALPALRQGRRLAPMDEQAARVHCCMALIASVDDTNLLHRGGPAGLAFAQFSARSFLAAGGAGQAHWLSQAQAMHCAFIERNLSPGGCADLLGMALFLDAQEV
jgi:triphosphoribosyl-dephospho-CoA synthase